MREDLIVDAVNFLKESSVASASLSKKIEFLKSKDLTEDEIQEALSRSRSATPEPASSSSASSVSNSSSPQSAYTSYPPPQYLARPPPPVPERDWKDYFVMATVSAGVAYGIYETARRYVLPLILPPTPEALEADKKALEEEFAKVQEMLDKLHDDSEKVLQGEKERDAKLARSLEEVDSVLTWTKAQTDERNTEIKLICNQVDNIQKSLPTALEEHRSQQDGVLKELKEELKSLKTLMQSRIVNGSSTPPPLHKPVPVPVINSAAQVPLASQTTTQSPPTETTTSLDKGKGRADQSSSPKPAIPAWQMASRNS